jgi:dethiobiotin synthetase
MTRPGVVVAVVGTATEIGKTWVTCRVITELRTAGRTVAARKPIQSFEPGTGPTDAELLAAATGEPVGSVCASHRWYGLPMAPPMAVAALGGVPFTATDILAELKWPSGVEVGFVETVGGVRSPATDDADSAALAALVAPDVVLLVADAGLGTINSVRLSTAALDGPAIVFLNRFDDSDELHRRNLAWLVDRDRFNVTTRIASAAAVISVVAHDRNDLGDA